MTNQLKLLLILLTTPIISCTINTTEQIQPLTPQPRIEEVEIEVAYFTITTRPPSNGSCNGFFVLLIQDEIIGEISAGQTKEFLMPVGDHRIDVINNLFCDDDAHTWNGHYDITVKKDNSGHTEFGF